MKPTTINGITVPQFETIDVFRDSDTDNVNEKVTAIHANNKIRDYFKNRVCVNCNSYSLTTSAWGVKRMSCDKLRMRINLNPETFSCAAFEEKT